MIIHWVVVLAWFWTFDLGIRMSCNMAACPHLLNKDFSSIMWLTALCVAVLHCCSFAHLLTWFIFLYIFLFQSGRRWKEAKSCWLVALLPCWRSGEWRLGVSGVAWAMTLLACTSGYNIINVLTLIFIITSTMRSF